MKRFVFLFASLVLISGCNHPEEVARKDEILVMTLTGFNPPKRAYATLRDSHGLVDADVYVSKRCSDWRKKAIVGNNYTVKRSRITYSDGSQRHKYHNLKELFC